MFKSLASIVIATAALISPALAGIHDFNPTNVGPSSPSAKPSVRIKGNCYSTEDDSSVCYFSEDDANYNVAIYDVDYPSHPLSVTINCQTGRWKAFGNMPKTQMTMWGNVLCRNLR